MHGLHTCYFIDWLFGWFWQLTLAEFFEKNAPLTQISLTNIFPVLVPKILLCQPYIQEYTFIEFILRIHWCVWAFNKEWNFRSRKRKPNFWPKITCIYGIWWYQGKIRSALNHYVCWWSTDIKKRIQWDLEETTTNIESSKLQVPEQARGDMSWGTRDPPSGVGLPQPLAAGGGGLLLLEAGGWLPGENPGIHTELQRPHDLR